MVYLINLDITTEYSQTLVSIAREPYFIRANLDRYLTYATKDITRASDAIVRNVNSKIYRPFYTGIVDSDVASGALMLVNKYYKLGEDYKPVLTTIGAKYSLGSTLQMDKTAYANFVEMANAAEADGVLLGVLSAYRDFASQRSVYASWGSSADRYAARAGHSEHRAVLAVDMQSRSAPNANFANTAGFTWMKNNAHKYGFILRYGSGKEYLTGYGYEAWHYRYVGKEVATKMVAEGLTFEEYHAFYVSNRGGIISNKERD